MDRRVTARRPTGALLQSHRVVGTPDKQLAATDLLEVALQTEVRIANTEQLGVDRPMDVVTGGASFTQGVVFEGVGTTLVGMAAKTVVILREQRGAAANHDGAFVRRMAGGACQSPFRHRMMAGQVELALDVQMALEAHRLLRAARFDLQSCAKAAGLGPAGGEAVGRFRLAAGLRVQAARAVAGFAAGVERVRPRGHQARVVRRGEITVELVMALVTFLGADRSEEHTSELQS